MPSTAEPKVVVLSGVCWTWAVQLSLLESVIAGRGSCRRLLWCSCCTASVDRSGSCVFDNVCRRGLVDGASQTVAQAQATLAFQGSRI